jgi:hypothetical protein
MESYCIIKIAVNASPIIVISPKEIAINPNAIAIKSLMSCPSLSV